jgi:hypothetical protein
MDNEFGEELNDEWGLENILGLAMHKRYVIKELSAWHAVTGPNIKVATRLIKRTKVFLKQNYV